MSLGEWVHYYVLLDGQRRPAQQPPVPGEQRALRPLLKPLQGC